VTTNNARVLYLLAREVLLLLLLDELQAVLLEEHPDILGKTDSWTHDDVLDAELSYDGYTLFRCDSHVIVRVVVLYVCNEYRPRHVTTTYLQIPGAGLVSIVINGFDVLVNWCMLQNNI